MASGPDDAPRGGRGWALAALAMWLVVVVAGLLAAFGRGAGPLVAAVLVASMSGLAMHAAWRSARREDSDG